MRARIGIFASLPAYCAARYDQDKEEIGTACSGSVRRRSAIWKARNMRENILLVKSNLTFYFPRYSPYAGNESSSSLSARHMGRQPVLKLLMDVMYE